MPASLGKCSSAYVPERSQHPQQRSQNLLSIPTASRSRRPSFSRQQRSQIKNRLRIAKAASEETAATTEETASTSGQYDEELSVDPPTSSSWELDFSSRPVLDDRGKKKWELLICSPDRSWQYSRWFPNNKINSTQVGSKRVDETIQLSDRALDIDFVCSEPPST